VTEYVVTAPDSPAELTTMIREALKKRLAYKITKRAVPGRKSATSPE
jgi:hypothetical protein